MPLASNPLRLPMLYLVLCVLLTGALAQRSPAPRAADRYPSCSTGTTGIQFVGIGNATGNGTCSWAAEGDTFWFIECINSWTVTADRWACTVGEGAGSCSSAGHRQSFIHGTTVPHTLPMAWQQCA